jgi:hypothetical protein
MAKQERFKILGQSSPNAVTNATLYTVPASTQSVISTINICNTTASATTCRVAAVPSGQSLSIQEATLQPIYKEHLSSSNLRHYCP